MSEVSAPASSSDSKLGRVFLILQLDRRSAARLQPKHMERVRLILTMLNVATHAGQMSAPGLGSHPLKGKPKGRFAVSVDENYRVVFRFEDGHAVNVDYGDYH